jgi:hypothetical protein
MCLIRIEDICSGQTYANKQTLIEDYGAGVSEADVTISDKS